MNKRIKKKRELLEVVQEVRKGQAMLSEAICNVLMCVEHDKQGQASLAQRVAELEKIHEQNTLSTNNCFVQVEQELKLLNERVDVLETTVKSKKSWWKR